MGEFDDVFVLLLVLGHLAILCMHCLGINKGHPFSNARTEQMPCPTTITDVASVNDVRDHSHREFFKWILAPISCFCAFLLALLDTAWFSEQCSLKSR